MDLDDWAYTLNAPFDPVVIESPLGTYLLASSEFSDAVDATDVRERAQSLIARLNGAMAILQSAKPVQCGGIVQVDEHGNRHTTVFAEAVGIVAARATMRATAEVIGSDGKVVPPPQPQPSAAQAWNALAAADDDVADLLEQHGKAQGWYEIYKTIEIAEAIMGRKGGTQKLARLLGTSGSKFLTMRQTANFYRHARALKPDTPTSLHDAKSLLNFLVRTVIDWRRGKEADQQ